MEQHLPSLPVEIWHHIVMLLIQSNNTFSVWSTGIQPRKKKQKQRQTHHQQQKNPDSTKLHNTDLSNHLHSHTDDSFDPHHSHLQNDSLISLAPVREHNSSAFSIASATPSATPSASAAVSAYASVSHSATVSASDSPTFSYQSYLDLPPHHNIHPNNTTPDSPSPVHPIHSVADPAFHEQNVLWLKLKGVQQLAKLAAVSKTFYRYIAYIKERHPFLEINESDCIIYLDDDSCSTSSSLKSTQVNPPSSTNTSATTSAPASGSATPLSLDDLAPQPQHSQSILPSPPPPPATTTTTASSSSSSSSSFGSVSTSVPASNSYTTTPRANDHTQDSTLITSSVTQNIDATTSSFSERSVSVTASASASTSTSPSSSPFSSPTTYSSSSSDQFNNSQNNNSSSPSSNPPRNVLELGQNISPLNAVLEKIPPHVEVRLCINNFYQLFRLNYRKYFWNHRKITAIKIDLNLEMKNYSVVMQNFSFILPMLKSPGLFSTWTCLRQVEIYVDKRLLSVQYL